MIAIANEFLSVTVTTKGGELTSLTDKRSGRNLLHEPSVKSWDRCDSVLFPFVGRMKDGWYTVDGVRYDVPIHGIAPYREFRVSKQTANTVTLTLTSDEQTLAQYPYSFVLDVTYELQGLSLAVTYAVTNTDKTQMPFYLGSHPAFALSASGGVGFDGKPVLDFESEKLDLFELENNFVSVPCVEKGKQILTCALFDKYPSLLGLRKKGANRITLSSSDGEIASVVSDSPVFCIWSPTPNGELVAIESWWGIPDEATPIRELSQKKHTQILQAGERKTYRYEIQLPTEKD